MKKQFFMTADKKYEHFIPLFIYFARYSNPKAGFEFIVNDPSEWTLFDLWCRQNLGISIAFQSLNTYPHVSRFVQEPMIKADYYYSGDVDILITEEVFDFHIKRMQETGLPFDNCVRVGKEKMSGLHCYTQKYLNDTRNYRKETKDRNLDEHFLYKICKNTYNDLGKVSPNNLDEFIQLRPIHGIHCSHNRNEWIIDQQHKEVFFKLTNIPLYDILKKQLHKDAINVIEKVKEQCKKEW